MSKKIFILFLVLIFLLPGRVGAQTQVQFSSLEADLWPEFDRPAMLVIYRITLSPQTSLPAQIRLRIPAIAGAPNAVAGSNPDGSLINIPYDQQDAGEWTQLVFQATTPDLQIEYYDPRLEKDGEARHYAFTWLGDYSVDAFTVEVQQPVGASNMRITPGMATSKPGADGLTYLTLDVGPLSVGQPFEISIDYQKPDDQLSSSGLPVEPSGPLDNTAAGRQSMTEALPWALGLLGVLLIAGGGLWYWQSGREQPQNNRKPRGRRKATSPVDTGEINQSDYVYCHQCGKRAAPGDRFCRACGTELRLG
jgi:hypothetical protein